jgi:hypothetical protein
MRQAARKKEEQVIRQLNGRSHAERYGALRTISERGGPGAVPLLSGILKGKATAKEKIRAAWAIRRIAYRTGIYYEGITALEHASYGDQPASVQSVAKRIRQSIAGDRFIATSPGCAIDDRILVSPKEKRTPDFLDRPI